MTQTFDAIVIGAGIVGAATAAELCRRHPGWRVAVLEKERSPAQHQTGRNSGVIHSGVYYTPGGLKARLCRQGAADTVAFCQEHGIAYETRGKLLVATDDVEVLRLEALERRAAENGVAVQRLDQAALRADEPRVRRVTREKVQNHSLKMKVSEAEWQFDRNKLTIYFTAERRVDFRQLVKDLARTFRTRIELKQIGVRDEAALLGGVGRCGRELCCSTWLRELKPVSLQLAKDQRLSLNPAQISGCCGRLMCCLTYEHAAYVEARKRFPREGKWLSTAKGRERVMAVDIWRERVMLKGEQGERRTVELAELKAEVTDESPLGGKRKGRRGGREQEEPGTDGKA